MKFNGSTTTVWSGHYFDTVANFSTDVAAPPGYSEWTKDNLPLLTDLQFEIEDDQRSWYQYKLELEIHYYNFQTNGTEVVVLNPGVGLAKVFNSSESLPDDSTITYALTGDDDPGFGSSPSAFAAVDGQTVGDYEYYLVSASLDASSGIGNKTPVLQSVQIGGGGPAVRLTKGINQFIDYQGGITTNVSIPPWEISGNINNRVNLTSYGNLVAWKHLIFCVGGGSSAYDNTSIYAYDTTNDTWFDTTLTISGHSTWSQPVVLVVVDDTLYVLDQYYDTQQEVNLNDPLIAFMKQRS